MEDLQFGMERVNLNTSLLFDDKKFYQLNTGIRFVGLRGLKLSDPNQSLEYVAQNMAHEIAIVQAFGPEKSL